MQKPADLRTFLTAAVPDFARDPDKIQIFVGKGKLVSTGTAGLSHEFRYTLTVYALDFAGEPEALMVPLLVWLRRNQPDMFDNPQRRAEGFRFEADPKNHNTVDLEVEIDLTERVGIARDDSGVLVVSYLPEPVSPDLPADGAPADVWMNGKQICKVPTWIGQ